MNMKTVYLTIGGEGSGKTTLSKFLSEKWEIPHCEFDKGGNALIRKMLASENGFILDAIFRHAKDVEDMTKYLKSEGIESVKLLWLNTSFVDRKRNMHRRAGDKVFREYVTGYSVRYNPTKYEYNYHRMSELTDGIIHFDYFKGYLFQNNS